MRYLLGLNFKRLQLPQTGKTKAAGLEPTTFGVLVNGRESGTENRCASHCATLPGGSRKTSWKAIVACIDYNTYNAASHGETALSRTGRLRWFCFNVHDRSLCAKLHSVQRTNISERALDLRGHVLNSGIRILIQSQGAIYEVKLFPRRSCK